MNKTRVLLAMGFCLFFISLGASAQTNRKPGLWEMTTTMTWQKSPMPAGMTMPAGSNSPFGGGAHTTQVCLTQAMIDKYGAPPPQSRNNQCQMSNVHMNPGSMTADWVCSGMMSGKGSVAILLDRRRSRHNQCPLPGLHADGSQRNPHRVHNDSHIRLQRLRLRQRKTLHHAGQIKIVAIMTGPRVPGLAPTERDLGFARIAPQLLWIWNDCTQPLQTWPSALAAQAPSSSLPKYRVRAERGQSLDVV